MTLAFTNLFPCLCMVLHACFVLADPAYKRSQNSLAAVNEAFSQRLIPGKKDV